MLEIGIPVYKAKDTLPDLLDSIVAQTQKKFFVCLSIDGDGEDYSEIIDTYKARGLKIRVINSDVNGGPGIARQRVLDSTQCDFLMYADADDLLMPRAVEVLYKKITINNLNIVRSSFIRTHNNTEDQVFKSNDAIVTWFHGKIYRVSYLKEKNINFLPELRMDEDAYFNMLAWNATTEHDIVDEITYIWRENPNSITVARGQTDYFIRSHMDYIHGQVEALKKLFMITPEVPTLLITLELINIFYHYMKARFYKCDEKEMDDCISTLKDKAWLQVWMQSAQNWIDVLNNIKPGEIYDGQYVVFFEEPFNVWAVRLFGNNEKEN